MNLNNRQFQWVSSSKEESSVILKEVDKKLSHFYSKIDGRELYQKLLDGIEEMPLKNEFSYLLLDYIIKKSPERLLEIGCANGRTYRQITKLGFAGMFTGIEVADYVIKQNQERHPDAAWITAGAYQIPSDDNQFDMCYAFFVLEHLVYPEKALIEMLRVLKKGGELVLIFPDFVASGRLESQELGLSPILRATEKLKKGKFFDAILSLYDSRIRLPKALKAVGKEVGNFPINVNPICFNYTDVMSHDIDAVYIASKQEIVNWAELNGYKTSFPYGVEGELAEKAFLVITK